MLPMQQLIANNRTDQRRRHSSSSSSSLVTAVASKRVYYCQRCLNHDELVPRKNHKCDCRYASCVCNKCILVEKRRMLNTKLHNLDDRHHNNQSSTMNDADRCNDDRQRNMMLEQVCALNNNDDTYRHSNTNVVDRHRQQHFATKGGSLSLEYIKLLQIRV